MINPQLYTFFGGCGRTDYNDGGMRHIRARVGSHL